MCDCVDIEMGSYDNQVTVWNPHYKTKEREFIDVDKCIAKELMKLWGLGIVTTGSCCGHNITVGYIGVTEEYKNIMRVMGYEKRFNESRPDDDCSFIPKSVPDPLEIPVDITNLTVSEIKSIMAHESIEDKILMGTFPASMIVNNRIDNSLMVDDSKMVGRKINELIGLGYTVEISGGTEGDSFIHLTLDRPGKNDDVNVIIMTDGDCPYRQILYTLQKMQEAIESDA